MTIGEMRQRMNLMNKMEKEANNIKSKLELSHNEINIFSNANIFCKKYKRNSK